MNVSFQMMRLRCPPSNGANSPIHFRHGSNNVNPHERDSFKVNGCRMRWFGGRECQAGRSREPPGKYRIPAHPDVIPSQDHSLMERQAPDFEFTDFEGNVWDRKKLLNEGPVVLIFYYGYHCTSCVRQLREIDRDLSLFRSWVRGSLQSVLILPSSQSIGFSNMARSVFPSSRTQKTRWRKLSESSKGKGRKQAGATSDRGPSSSPETARSSGSIAAMHLSVVNQHCSANWPRQMASWHRSPPALWQKIRRSRTRLNDSSPPTFPHRAHDDSAGGVRCSQ